MPIPPAANYNRIYSTFKVLLYIINMISMCCLQPWPIWICVDESHDSVPRICLIFDLMGALDPCWLPSLANDPVLAQPWPG